MASPAYDTLLYLWGWARGRGSLPAGVVTEDVAIGYGSGTLAARRYASASRKPPLPGWVLLHGVTRPGPDHPGIVRFAAALARAGGAVLVPDIPAWRRLELDPEPAQAALTASVDYMRRDSRVRPGVVLVGLSFGCPQALRVGAGLAGPGGVRGVVGFGGYCRLLDTVRFGLTGQFEWLGRTEYLRPDPYGRWVVASNYLHRIPGYRGTKDVSRALHKLASLAGDRRIMSWDPGYDDVKVELTESVSRENRELFRLFAPSAGQEPDPGYAADIAPLLAAAARETHPHLELSRCLGDGPPPPVHLIHGRRDHLIPFTETLALERLLRKQTDVAATVTDLFAHSGESGKSVARLREAASFFAGLRGVMALHAG